MLPRLPGYHDAVPLDVFVRTQLRVQAWHAGDTCGVGSSDNVVVCRVDDDVTQTACDDSDGMAAYVYRSLAAPPQPPWLSSPSSSSWSSLARLRDAQQCCHRRPLTARVLRRRRWHDLFAQLSDDAATYLCTHCVVVVAACVDSCVRGGALQVLGPALSRHAHRVTPYYRVAASATQQQQQQQQQGVKSDDATTTTTTHTRQTLPPLASLDAGSAATRLLQPLHACQHTRKRPRSSGVDDDSNVVVDDVCLDSVFAYSLAPSSSTTTRPQQEQQQRPQPHGSTSTMLREHLRHVVSTLQSQCARRRVVHSCAQRHLRFYLARMRNHHHHHHNNDSSSDSVQQWCVPADIVVSYVHDVLSRVKYTPPTAAAAATRTVAATTTTSTRRRRRRHAAKRTTTSSHVQSFWGTDAAAARVNVSTVCATLRAWLCARRATTTTPFALAHWLHGMRVGRLPWLCGCYTHVAHATRAATAVTTTRNSGNARVRRSLLQQRVYMQVIGFLLRHVLPPLLHAAFHITRTARSAHEVVFVAHGVWCRLLRRELTRLCASPSPLLPPRRADARLQRVYVVQPCDTHDDDATTRHGGGRGATDTPQPSSPHAARRLLYAHVRLLPDVHKLRPIAVVRSAHAHALTRLARGTRPHTPRTNDSHRSTAATRRRRQGGATTTSARPEAALRVALQCLSCELHAHRVRHGSDKLTNRTHADEYAALRGFVESVRRRQQEEVEQQQHDDDVCATSTSSRVVTLLRCDAVRCYDYLPQDTMLQIVHTLVSHTSYRLLSLTLVRVATSLPPPPQQRQQQQQRDNDACVLQRQPCTLVVPWPDDDDSDDDDDVATQLLHMPTGAVACEEATHTRHVRDVAATAMTTATTRTAASSSLSATSSRIVCGAAVRATLREHVCAHLVCVHGRLYQQHHGLVQGSAVAMLLCDVLLMRVVDAALCSTLVQHDALSLLLRRVDDVLVATTSRVAAAQCYAAMRRGWPSAGYVSHARKLHYCSSNNDNSDRANEAAAAVSWCGLRIHARTCDVAVDWTRVAAVLARQRVYACRGVANVRPAAASSATTTSCVRATARQAMTLLCRRLVPTVLCRRINTRARVAQTLYEAALLWCRQWLRVLACDVLPYTLPRRARVACVQQQLQRLLLQQPVACAAARLYAHVQRQHRTQLLRVHSYADDVTARDVSACLWLAMHRTLQAQLRRRVAVATWRARVRASRDAQLRAATPSTRRTSQQQQQNELHQQQQQQDGECAHAAVVVAATSSRSQRRRRRARVDERRVWRALAHAAQRRALALSRHITAGDDDGDASVLSLLVRDDDGDASVASRALRALAQQLHKR